MPEHLRALVVILTLATAVFAFAKTPACAIATVPEDFERRRNLWFGITLVVFLAHNFWIYIIIGGALLLLIVPRDPNKLAMHYFLLFAVPAIPADISGLGVVRYFFTIDYIRLLALAVLLPAFLSLRKQANSDRFGLDLPDKLIAGYIILNVLLMLTVSTVTNTLRQGVFYSFIDIFLPYYVASRSLKTLKQFRDVLMAFVLAALVLCPISAVETAKHWLLYRPLGNALGEQWEYGRYLMRGESGLRAIGSAGHAIPLGYIMAVAFGFFLYLRRSIPNPIVWGLGLLLLSVGLISPLSRGPWVGAGAMLLLFVATSPSPGRRLVNLGLPSFVVFTLLLATPVGEKIIDLLPFVGTIETENVIYRQRLLEISIQVIQQNPFFGAFNFFYSPQMQELKQGQGGGMIDLVNTYLAVGLSSGLVGLSLFLGFFIVVAAGIFKRMRNLTDRNDELYVLGQALLCTLLGIMVTIFTVSSITVIPVIYWSVAGLGVAYARMLALTTAPAKTLEVATHSRFRPTAMK